MRCKHNRVARFRVNDHLFAEAANKARADGVTFSELVRQALCRELAEAA